MIRLDAATFLLQWATGGLAFLWVTTRRREVGIGYGWLMRIVFGLLAVGALLTGTFLAPLAGRDIASALVVTSAAWALVVSVVRRKAGVAGEHERRRDRQSRVAAMVETTSAAETSAPSQAAPSGREFPPSLDLVAPLIGVGGLVWASLASGGPTGLALARNLAGAAFLGAVSDAMLLGHWYLVQPGLGRGPLRELNRWLAITWPAEVGALLLPVGMVSVLSGRVNDGWGGTLGWFWLACATATLGLTVVTHAALKEKSYSAVMAATGLLYLAIITAFGTDLVARAILA